MSNQILVFIVSFFVCILLMPIAIKLLRKLKFGQNVLHYVEAHKSKQGTPTMGGVVFVLTAIVVFLIFLKPNFSLSIMLIATFVAFTFLGFLDDFLKIKHKDNLGLRAYQKAFGQLFIAVIVSIFAYKNIFIGSNFIVPFAGTQISLGIFAIFVIVFIFIATSNAVNLTDGLDGLASGVSLVFLAGTFIMLQLNITKATDSGMALNYINELKNLSTFTMSLTGALFGFFVFNTNKASIFMGDVGSLSLGAFIAGVCIFSKLSFYIIPFGIMFIVSVVSVVIQVLHFKRTRKRVFLMAPFHHHLEKKGMNENKVVAIYIAITLIFVLGTIAIELV